jgi:hypothetical protein
MAPEPPSTALRRDEGALDRGTARSRSESEAELDGDDEGDGDGDGDGDGEVDDQRPLSARHPLCPARLRHGFINPR